MKFKISKVHHSPQIYFRFSISYEKQDTNYKYDISNRVTSPTLRPKNSRTSGRLTWYGGRDPPRARPEDGGATLHIKYTCKCLSKQPREKHQPFQAREPSDILAKAPSQPATARNWLTSWVRPSCCVGIITGCVSGTACCSDIPGEGPQQKEKRVRDETKEQ